MAGDPSFDVFRLPEEHDELRAAIRALAEKEIAPHAAAWDKSHHFPAAQLKGLAALGCYAQRDAASHAG